MKKLVYLLVAAAALLSVSSCNALLESLSSNPVFELAGSTVYDGQKAFLGTTATCKIGWKTNNSNVVTLNYDENGKNCVATFKLANDVITDVEVTATNLDDNTIDPYTGSFTVVPWKLTIFQKVDGKWVQVSNANDDYFVWTNKKAGSNTFKVQMQALKSDKTYEDISNVIYKIALKNSSHVVNWQGDILPEQGEKAVYSQEFTLDQVITKKTIKATLGVTEKEISIIL